jgi:hypothetical protein
MSQYSNIHSTNVHNIHVEKLKNNFSNIISLKTEIAKTKSLVAEKLQHLKNIYGELLKTNGKKIFLFCLDSFYFQYKTFAIEMDNIDRFRVLMNNRMYCDYYKLYNIILSSIKENTEIILDDSEMKSFPPYKDLEPFQEYKIDDIRDIHDNILILINKLHTQSSSKKYNIDHYNEKHRIGFSISNFINTLEYENRLMNEQISLYINYLSFFHISQKKQIQRLFLRINEFHKEVNDNINVNQTFSIDDIQEEQKLNRFFITGEEVAIENILEDSELLIKSGENIMDRIDNIIQFKEGVESAAAAHEPEEVNDILANILLPTDTNL